MLCLQLIRPYKWWSDLFFSNHHDRYNRQRQKSDKQTIKRGHYRYGLNQMPEYLRFNQWILTGYRSPNLSTIECVQSVCLIHNETVNIMTHVIPIVYIVFNYHTMFGPHLFRSYLTYFHLISCLSSWIGSLCYHIFMNHHCGSKIYRHLLKVDMLGIWITQTFGALTTIQASFIMFDESIRYQSVIIYLMISIFALYKGLTASKAWQRPASFALLVTIRVICFIVRIQTHQYNVKHPHHYHNHPSHFVNDNNTNNQISSIITIISKNQHVIGQEIWPIIGAIIAVTRIPERFFPGKFDYFLNSHNIMHCLVVLGGIHMHWSFIDDIEFFI
ncbi:progestin and adipoQ receptor family member 4 [Dermatophagoides farinae]|mgnify:CR=1 FL=1|uniref:Progestin and adipoQ receptor member 4 n=1 Tax=Dermatophagoides farinae TaxID=6954 RepID=A0A922L5Z5_DERFA|nr:progestin and adipoQ receptor family member 4-like [Dermatophagoides farinae]KAH9521169.1 Progestin and adipoQ receptor member 4 [Dermatophagoides farinae]